ncbi:hypothetical protein [Flammeovirga sp. SubArs3]|nr:hypothetical protein [Flammeovirga sp. SubArs3]
MKTLLKILGLLFLIGLVSMLNAMQHGEDANITVQKSSVVKPITFQNSK